MDSYSWDGSRHCRRQRKFLRDFITPGHYLWLSLILASISLWNGSFAQNFDGSSVLIGKNISNKFNGSSKPPTCTSNVCLNGGACFVVNGSFDCLCPQEYTGILCQVALSSDSICNPKCPKKAQCIKSQCVCPRGTESCPHVVYARVIKQYCCCCLVLACASWFSVFQGACRGIVIDPCSSIQCLNNGTCTEKRTRGGGQRVSCQCPSGFRGSRCEILAPPSILELNPCRAAKCPAGQKCISRNPIFICVPDTNDSSSVIVDPGVVHPVWNNSESAGNNSSALLINDHESAVDTSIIGQPFSSEVNSMCDERPCFNKGNCTPTQVAPGFQCSCPPGWGGARCEMDVKECRSKPCQNGGTCQEIAGGFNCLCKPGYSGKMCEENNNDCLFNPCRHSGTCVDGINDFTCLCHANWTGKTCEILYNACDSAPCNNEGGCSTLPPSKNFTCTCPAGFIGDLCEVNIDDCVGIVCPLAGQVCVDLVERQECRCPDGLSGSGCAENVNECNNRTGLCLNGATCLDDHGGYRCLCRTGYTGTHCEISQDICSTNNPCVYGICQDTKGIGSGYQCFCRPGYMGTNCTQDFDECYSSPCQNRGLCVDSANAYVCLCPFPFTGQHCETLMQGCDSSPCRNNGTCQKNMLGYDCICPPGTTGRNCEHFTTNPCNSNPCYSGTRCVQTSFGPGYQCVIASQNLADANACDSVTCLNNGTCSSSPDGSYQCRCHAGYRGIHCEEDIADCIPNPCFNGGSCLEKSNQTVYDLGLISGTFDYNQASGFICLCPAGLGGSNCGEPKSSCEPNPCANRGECVATAAGFQCVCAPGFTGRICSSDIDECSQGSISGTQGPCVNANQCLNTPGSYRCECMLGWGGPKCDTQLLGCFKQPCSGNATCQPYLTPEGQHAFECVCPGGRAGRNCELDTVAGFSGRSLIAFVTNPPPDNYSLSLQFRTTLDNVLLLSGDDILGRTVFTVELAGGNLKLKWMEQPLVLENLHRSLHDGDWKKVKIGKLGAKIELAILDSYSGLELMQESLVVPEQGLNVFSTKFGRTTNQRALGMDTSDFIGCMRDMRVNGQQLVPAQLTRSSANIQLSCTRVEQCTGNPCNDHGKCMDKWNTYECACLRPYLPPDCSFAFPEATFGYERNRSYAQVNMNTQEEESLELKIDISMLIKTRSLSGSLLYMGSETNPNPALDTFVSLQLFDGQLRANTKLGGGDILPFVGGPKLNDGEVHEIGFTRRDNTVQGFVDDEMVFQGKLRHPFPHPLLASHFYIGGYPMPYPDSPVSLFDKREKRQAKDKQTFPSQNGSLQRVVALNQHAFNTAKTFKGTIQDVRINGMHIVLLPGDVGGKNVERFGRVNLFNNVLNGTVSDDTCRASPCENGATCLVTFNDYECTCMEGWRGKNCSKVDHCYNADICPAESNCQNTETGYICLTAGTFNKGSSAQFILQDTSRQNRSMFYTISFKIRTRDQSGIVFYGSSPDQNFLLLELTNGNLDLVYRLGSAEIVKDLDLTRNANISDGKWHEIKLTLLTEQSYVNLNGNQTALDVFISGAPLFVGSVPRDLAGLVPDRFASGSASFKGCIDDLVFGDLPPVTFLDKTLYGNPDTRHFVPFDLNGVASECRGEAQCGPDGVIGPCQNGARCRDLWNARKCECQPGFRGQLCEENIDDCVNNQCDSQHGTCVDGIQNYTCACASGYGGRFCEFEIDECESSPCANGGTCLNLLAKFQCVCNANYTGDMCEVLITVDCDSNPCQNGASCLDWHLGRTAKSFNCSCVPGYEGRTCEYEIDYCQKGPCANGASCRSITQRQDYLCNCLEGYTGKDCDIEINECDSSPCQNDGTCVDGLANFTCTCAAGWEGLTCGLDKDECTLGTPCAGGSTCINTAGSYMCQCPQYYLGSHCELEGSCLSSPCIHGTCSQLTPSQHVCNCSLGYTGQECQTEIDYCASSPCLQGGTCKRFVGGFNCSCIPGLSDLLNGYHCNCEGTGYNGTTCARDVDECHSSSNYYCVNGDCNNIPGGYSCACKLGYIGTRCAHVNPCMRSADNITGDAKAKKQGHGCKNRAKCQNPRVALVEGTKEVVQYDCECTSDFDGAHCEFAIQPAQAGGTPLAYVVGPILGILILLCIVGCIFFVMVARKKRATRGHYSPSRQEMTGARVQMGPMIKPPPEERLI